MSRASLDMSRLTREQLETRCMGLETQMRSLDKRVRELWRENCDLRALACFLDDERIAARDLAREMSENARSEWMSMRNKLQQLEERQFELVRDNFELKQLCLILDAERDTNNDLAIVANKSQSSPQVLNHQILSYIRELESRVTEPDPELTLRRPQVIGDAMRVLQVHESDGSGETTREERAILNNLCRTAWRQLEERETV